MIKKNTHSATVAHIIDRKLCNGCGACSVVCPKNCITLIQGKRYNYARLNPESCTHCGRCLRVCPGAFLLKGITPHFDGDSLEQNSECLLIHSTNDTIRFDAASGGFVTGIILYLMDQKECDGAIVARTSQADPLHNESFLALTREELLDARGSRYAPVSNCVALKDVIGKKGRYVFVGTPCQIEGLVNLQKYYPELRENIILKIGFICLGTASRTSTRSYLAKYDVDIEKIGKISYRGNGWPGSFTVLDKDNNVLLRRPLLEYINNTVIGDELRHLVPQDHYLRCRNCRDHWAWFADIAVSDPWCHKELASERIGKSAIALRTVKGQSIVHRAIKDNYFVADPITPADISDHQKTLVRYSQQCRESWMPLYQMLFMKKIVNPLGIVKNRGRGLSSIMKEFKNKNYYNEPELLA
ncbi:MAG: 4Fe-4S dicluster domain-containing protein [Chitinivibrionales bacterium]|nr:4Fe-4S dicluster domain-containing protein [Chitinivibrionales bacterium]